MECVYKKNTLLHVTTSLKWRSSWLAGLMDQLRERSWGQGHLRTSGERAWGVGGTKEHVSHLPGLPQPTEEGSVDGGGIVAHGVLSTKEHPRSGGRSTVVRTAQIHVVYTIHHN